MRVGTGVPDGPKAIVFCFLTAVEKRYPLIYRTVEDCTVQYDSIQVVQDDCIQFCDIIKAEK